MMLEPYFLSKIAELKCEGPEFERLLLRARAFDAIFRVITVYSIDLLYLILGTGCS